MLLLGRVVVYLVEGEGAYLVPNELLLEQVWVAPLRRIERSPGYNRKPFAVLSISLQVGRVIAVQVVQETVFHRAVCRVLPVLREHLLRQLLGRQLVQKVGVVEALPRGLAVLGVYLKHFEPTIGGSCYNKSLASSSSLWYFLSL